MINLQMPDDIRNYVILKQAEMKQKRLYTNYSQQQTIIQIIREHKKYFENAKDVPEHPVPENGL